MIAQGCLLSLCLSVVCALPLLAKQTTQPDGIISIIRELEPERAPVGYLQAQGRTARREAPTIHVDETPPPPLAEGEFRVRSEKIRVVDPKTGFQAVHEVKSPEILSQEPEKKTEESERRRSIKTEPPSSGVKVIFPSRDQEELLDYNNYKELRRYSEESPKQNGFKRAGRYRNFGFQTQTPKKDNTVRTDTTTRIRNNDEPPKVFKQTYVRPATESDEIRSSKQFGKVGRYGTYETKQPILDTDPRLSNADDGIRSSKKFGKPGRYGKYETQRSNIDIVPGVGEVYERSHLRSDPLSDNNQNGRKSKKEYSTKTVVRFPDGYAKDNERRVESSSKYRTGSKVNNSYRNPTVTTHLEDNRKFDSSRLPTVRTSLNENLNIEQPLAQADTIIESGPLSGIDDGLLEEDNGVSYSAGGIGSNGFGLGSYEGGGDSSFKGGTSSISGGGDSTYISEAGGRTFNDGVDGINYRESVGESLDGVSVGEGDLVGVDGGSYGGKGYGVKLNDRGYGISTGHAHGYGGGYGGEFDKEKHYEKEKDKEYVTGHKSAHGERGDKGHNNAESYSKGKSEQHGQDENKGYSVEKEGNKKAYLDKSKQYASGHQSSQGAKGADFQKDKGHRKGHKKSGFRTVHHKDEYKKNEEFYDEEHDSGEVKKHGHKEAEHSEQSGGNDQKSHLDSAHHQASRGQEGGHEKGNGFNQQKGYHKEKGHSGYHGDQEDYGKQSGFKKGEAHGHSEYGGHTY